MTIVDKRNLVLDMIDTSLPNRKRGNALEDYILQEWPASLLLSDSPLRGIRKTRCSGSLHGDGDLIVGNGDITIDGKVKGRCTCVSVKKAELDKVRQQAAKVASVGVIATPIITEDKADIYITIHIEDLVRILAEAEETNEPN